MLNQTFIGQKGTYFPSKEIGKGGEGTVYELSNQPAMVLKLYAEPLNAIKVKKLRLMASIANSQLNNYTAWVNDVVELKGMVCGFTMKKLVNYFPLHMLFSPMDRKKLFPDKGYNFLVHVARNLATAFHACHSAGLVIGDVNEGNILVNSQGMIAFIDCDSFQLKDGNAYYFCEVGVPRYTPPELLEKASFDNVIRTVNTDNFSMAVIIFQLLFLGRHPFAGKNNTNEDIDEETAIKKYWFAYSLNNAGSKLIPPNDSYDIRNLNNGLSQLFHQAFEIIDNRPTPSQWIKELDNYLKELVVCKISKIHTYPSKLSECPWCAFRERRNILYFLDDNYLEQNATFNDIDKFINGFRIETLQYPKLQIPETYSDTPTPAPIDSLYIKYKWCHRIVVSLPVIVSLGLAFTNGWFIVGGIIFAAILNEQLPWKKLLQAELKKRESNYQQVKGKLVAAVKEYNSPVELRNYQNAAKQIEQYIQQYKNLPSELFAKKKAMEERVYDEQLHRFLSNFDIRNYEIPSFGATRKLALYTAGIRNASEISRLKTIKVPGIGSAFEQKLFYWQRQVTSKFVYRPDNNLLRQQYSLIVTEIEQAKKRMETSIKTEYESMNRAKANINNRQDQLKKYIDAAIKQYFQSDADLQAFKKIAF